MFSFLCKGRCLEFFEGENNRLSMMRLTVFLSFWPASYVVITSKTEGVLGWYLSAYVLGYVGGKGADVIAKWSPEKKEEKVKKSRNQDREEES